MPPVASKHNRPNKDLRALLENPLNNAIIHHYNRAVNPLRFVKGTREEARLYRIFKGLPPSRQPDVFY